MALPLLAAAVGGTAAGGNDWAGRFFGQHQAQSSQSYSAAVARDLGLMNQYFTYENMTYSEILQEMLNNQAYGLNAGLERLQAELQEGLTKSSQASSYSYEKKLAEYSQLLNALSADQDYARSVAYVRDNLLAYKNALIEAGYNPLLALGSSAAQYSGHTNPASYGSVHSGGNVSGASVSSGGVSGHSPSSPSGISSPVSSVPSSSFANAIQASINVAKSASEIQANEAQATRDKATAAESLEKAKTEATQRTDTGHKIQSEVAKNYGNIATGVATGIGTAYGASKATKAVKAAVGAMRNGNPSAVRSATDTVAQAVGDSATSAHIGSRMLGAVLPFAAGASMLYSGNQGMKDAMKVKGGDDSYDKWRRVYFPMAGGR